MPLRGVDGRFYEWCVVCQSRLPEEHKTLRIHLSRSHVLELLPGCPSCFYYRSRWSDVKKHCQDRHRLDINVEQGSRGCAWGLTALDTSRHRPSYAYVKEEDICEYPLSSETLSEHQKLIRDRARHEPSASSSQQPSASSSQQPSASSSQQPSTSKQSGHQPRSTVVVCKTKRPRTRSVSRKQAEDGDKQAVTKKGKGKGKSSSRPRPTPVEPPPRRVSPSPSPAPQLAAPVDSSSSAVESRSRRRGRKSLEEVTQLLSSTADSFETVSGLDPSPAVYIPVLEESEPVNLSRQRTSTPCRQDDTSAELPSDLPEDVLVVYPEAPETLRRRPRKCAPSLTSTPEQLPPTPGRVSSQDEAHSLSAARLPEVQDAATSASATTETVAVQTDVSLSEDDVLLVVPKHGGRLNVTPL